MICKQSFLLIFYSQIHACLIQRTSPLSLGTIGFFACFWFVTKIYSVVKVDWTIPVWYRLYEAGMTWGYCAQSISGTFSTLKLERALQPEPSPPLLLRQRRLCLQQTTAFFVSVPKNVCVWAFDWSHPYSLCPTETNSTGAVLVSCCYSRKLPHNIQLPHGAAAHCCVSYGSHISGVPIKCAYWSVANQRKINNDA